VREDGRRHTGRTGTPAHSKMARLPQVPPGQGQGLLIESAKPGKLEESGRGREAPRLDDRCGVPCCSWDSAMLPDAPETQELLEQARRGDAAAAERLLAGH